MVSVIGQNEILLNNERYPISGPVRKTLVSIAAPRFTIGDTQRGADPRASIFTQNDFRGGIGWERGIDPSTIDRTWWTDCQTRFKGHVLLPAKKIAASNNPAGAEIKSVTEFYGSLLAVVATGNVYQYLYPSDSWSASLTTLTGATTQTIVYTNSTDSYLLIARGENGYTYVTSPDNGGTFTFTTHNVGGGSHANANVEFFAIWHNEVWAIDKDGILKSFGTDPTSNPVEYARLPLPENYVTSLFVYRSAAGDPIIYAGTKVGLWAYDEANDIWEQTELRLPFHKEAGSGTVVWRDAVYFPAGNGIYKYQTGSNTAVVSLVGFDRDHGIPGEYAGQITKLVGTHNDLLAFLNADADVEYAMFATGRQNSGLGGASQIVSGTGTSTILGWNETAWEVKWTGARDGDDNIGLRAVSVGSAYDEYRVWFATGAKLNSIALSADVINPDQVDHFEYASAGELITSWFDGGDIAGSKTALTFRIITSSCSANETITVDYATDFTSSYIELGTITSNGITTYKFGSGVGIEFSSIRFRFTFASSSLTASPDLNLIELRWREKLPPKFGFSVTVDATKSFRGNTPKELVDNIQTILNTNTLVPFTFRDNDSDRTYYVDLVAASGFEFTGLDERAQVQLQLVET